MPVTSLNSLFSPEGAPLLSCALGLGFGLVHAFEADHVAAVTTLVTSGKGPRAAAQLGAAWGFGHAIPLLSIGAVLVALDWRVPASISDGLELVVVAMLVVLGVRAIAQALKKVPDLNKHSHAHQHNEPHDHDAPHTQVRTPRGAVLIGFIHGASGTAAVALSALLTLPSRGFAIAYLVLYALGALVGMASLSAVLSIPLRATATRWPKATQVLRFGAGAFSLTAAGMLLMQVTSR